MYLKTERWIIKSSQHVSLSEKWWMNTASFSCGLQGAEISVTDEKPLESGVLRMWKINCKNVNSVKPFKTEGLRVMAQRKVVRTLTAHHSLTVVIVIMISSAGFHSASSTCTGGLTTPVQVNIGFFSSAYLNNFAFSSSGDGQHNDMMIFWFYFLIFLLGECILTMLNTSIIKVFMLLIRSPTLFLCTNSELMFFQAISGNRKAEIWSKLHCSL